MVCVMTNKITLIVSPPILLLKTMCLLCYADLSVGRFGGKSLTFLLKTDLLVEAVGPEEEHGGVGQGQQRPSGRRCRCPSGFWRGACRSGSSQPDVTERCRASCTGLS